jgi:hypothetical protein
METLSDLRPRHRSRRQRRAPGEAGRRRVLHVHLFVEQEYRRSGVAFTMADHFFRKYPPGSTTYNYGYGFISYDNVPSIMWHHSVGFQIAQTMNYVEIGPFIKWKIPFSDMPRFGPMSRKGRHTDPSKDVFGPPLFP